MKVGLIDVDGRGFPNIALMKISEFHKRRGDSVEWYNPMFSEHMDRVYMSKVFSFSPDYNFYIDADEVIKGGTGYCIRLEDGLEVYNKALDRKLPYDVEHIYPDYSLYNISNTAYGFMSRGCPRKCSFCHVKDKEGTCSEKVSNLSEFWNGQKYIQLCDPNTLACKEWESILLQLVRSKAYVDFNQGLDIRLMNEEKAELIKQIKIKRLHFAWDNYRDKDLILPKFEMFKKITNINFRNLTVYVLINFDTTTEEDLESLHFKRTWL